MTKRTAIQRRVQLPAIAETLWKMIRTDGLEAGDKLPPERMLAEKFGVTRGEVRRGIQSLAERGVLARRQGDGTYIASVSGEDFVKESMGMAMVVKPDLLAEVLEFRRMLEPQIASLAAGRLAERDLDALKILVCNQQLQGGEGAAELDAAFHLRLAECSGNSVLATVMALIDDILAESRAGRYQSEERRTLSVAGHLRILEALGARDPERAFLAMRDHLEQVETLVVNNVQAARKEE